jgi:hypothetical protein
VAPTWGTSRLLCTHAQQQASGAATYRSLRDMMKSFMISGSPNWGTELDEDTCQSDMMPFPGENVIMMIYDGCPPAREASRF